MPMLASKSATPAKMPSNHIISRVWPTACATIALIDCGSATARPGSTVASAERTNFVTASTLRLLRPRPVEFYIVRLRDLARAHVGDDADDFRRRAVTADEQRLADRIFAAENFLRAALADQDHVLAASDVVLIEIAPGQKRNAKGLDVIRCNVVEDGGGTFVNWENLTVGPRIKCVAYAGWD